MEIICFQVEKWYTLAKKFTNLQEGRLFGTSLHCMLQIPPTKMRMGLLKFLLQAFDPTTENFLLNEGKDQISLNSKDVCIVPYFVYKTVVWML
jgi:hypothetical protein